MSKVEIVHNWRAVPLHLIASYRLVYFFLGLTDSDGLPQSTAQTTPPLRRTAQSSPLELLQTGIRIVAK